MRDLPLWIGLMVGCSDLPCDDPSSDACHLHRATSLAAEQPRRALDEARAIRDDQTRDAALLELVRLTGMNACPDVVNPTARVTCDDLRGRRHLWGAGTAVDTEVEDKQQRRRNAEAAARRGDLGAARASCREIRDPRSRDECAFRVAEAGSGVSAIERAPLCAEAGEFADHCLGHLRREGIREAVGRARGGGFAAVVAELEPVGVALAADDEVGRDGFWQDAFGQVFLALEPAALAGTSGVEASLAVDDARRDTVAVARAYAWVVGAEPAVTDFAGLQEAWRAEKSRVADGGGLSPTDPLPWAQRPTLDAPWGNRPWPLDASGGCVIDAEQRVQVGLVWGLSAGDSALVLAPLASAVDTGPPVVRAYAVSAALEHVFDKGAGDGAVLRPLRDAFDRLAADADPTLSAVGTEAAAALLSGKPPRRTDRGRALCGKGRP